MKVDYAHTIKYNKHGQALCGYGGCNRLHAHHGLCSAHNIQLKNKGYLTDLRPAEHTTCSHPECDKWQMSRGLCGTHYAEAHRKKRAMLKDIADMENQIKEMKQLISEGEALLNLMEDN